MSDVMLEVKNLTINFETHDGIIKAVSDVSFKVGKGRTLGLAGETGAGKTTTALGIMRLVPNPPGVVKSGDVILDDVSLYSLSKKKMRAMRGASLSMIFQDPMTSLNPVMKIGDQIAESIRLHEKLTRVEAAQKARDMLELVGIPGERYSEYPHEFSGGMRQRVVIAIALSCNPKFLIADEPTTALDVTIQAQILELMNNLKKKLDMSVLMITHDLGVVAEACDDVAIMYAGEIVEYSSTEQIFENTKHPYAIGLFGSIPKLDEDVDRLTPIKGMMPDPANLPVGCNFQDRCPRCCEICKQKKPELTEVLSGHYVRCHLVAKETD
ncbi:MAG: ABC transporter ATP-binding protein [Sphaerochaetaceae bacterium]